MLTSQASEPKKTISFSFLGNDIAQQEYPETRLQFNLEAQSHRKVSMNSIQDCQGTAVYPKNTGFMAAMEGSERCAETETCIYDTPKKDAPQDLPPDMVTSSQDVPLFGWLQTTPD